MKKLCPNYSLSEGRDSFPAWKPAHKGPPHGVTRTVFKRKNPLQAVTGTKGIISIVLFLITCIILVTYAHAQTNQQGSRKHAWEISNQRDLGAAVQSAAFDPKYNSVYLATLVNLFEVRDGKATSIAKSPTPGSQLQLAPGGNIYAWLFTEEKSRGLYFGYLMDIQGNRLAELRLDSPPYGFGALVLGLEGKLILTATPLDDWQGVHGRFRYTFWSKDGHVLETVIRSEREIPIASVDGGAVLLLGRKESTAYSPEGKLMWRTRGSFRKGAIARGGQLALLNPAGQDEINQVYVVTGSGQPTVVKLPTPVHHLRIAPDGSVAVIGGDSGRYFFLDTASGKLEEGKRLPFDNALFISDINLVNRDLVAIGVLQREGKPPQHKWPRGSLVVINRKGEVLFQTEYSIREPLSSRPAVVTTFEDSNVIAFTLDKTILVRLEGSR